MGILMSVLIIIALVFAIMLGYSLKTKFEDIRLSQQLDAARIHNQLNMDY